MSNFWGAFQSDVYAIITDNYGNNTIAYAQSADGHFIYEYDETKEYTYTYEAFFKDGTPCQSGEVYTNGGLKGTESGTWHRNFTLAIYHPTNPKLKLGDRDFWFDIKISEKPDNRVTPEVYFEPNGATIEGDGDEIRYVYKYDSKEHWPFIKAKYNGEEIEVSPYDGGIGTIKLNGEIYRYRHPRDIGEYLVEYEIDTDEYVNEIDRERFYNLRVMVIVEIKE